MLQGGLAARAPGKHLRQPFEQLPLPCGHLVRMKLAPRRDRLHAVPLAQRLERYPCLELRREPPSLPGHLGASSSALESTLTTCPKNRDHLTGPDPTAGRVVQAVQLVRDNTVGANFVSAYFGSLPFATLDRGEESNAPMSVPRVIEDAQTWADFWDEHIGAPSAAPAVDFATELVLVAAVGTRPEAGDSVEVRGVLPVGFGTQVTPWERRSGNFCTPAARSHAPFHVVLAPQVPRPIFFAIGDVDKVPCG